MHSTGYIAMHSSGYTKQQEAAKSTRLSMTSSSSPVVGIPIGSVSYATAEEFPRESTLNLDSDSLCDHCKQDRKKSFGDWITSIRAKIDRKHGTYQTPISTVKDKLRFTGSSGKAERALGQAFSVSNGEKLVKASKCHLWTTAGPIAGTLFLTTEKVAFLGDRSVRVSVADGTVAEVPYKVLVPLSRIKKTAASEHLNKRSEKYVQIVTVDDFEMWFMGVAGYSKFYKYLQQALSEHNEFLPVS